MQVGAQRGVADQHGGVRLLHHQAQVGRAGVVVGPDAVALGQQQLRQPHRGAGGRAEGHPGPVELLQRELGDDHAGHDGPVAADRDVGEGHQVVGVAQVLHEGDRADVELPLISCSLSRSGVSLESSRSSRVPVRARPQYSGRQFRNWMWPTRGRLRRSASPSRGRRLNCPHREARPASAREHHRGPRAPPHAPSVCRPTPRPYATPRPLPGAFRRTPGEGRQTFE